MQRRKTYMSISTLTKATAMSTVQKEKSLYAPRPLLIFVLGK
jgi:hypothetical protein